MKKCSLKIWYILVFVFILSSCSSTNDHDKKEEVAVKEGATINIIDRAGREIAVPKEVGSIISLSPAITQVVVDLGLEEKLVAIDDYSLILLNSDGKTREIQTFNMGQPDVEKMALLNPDLVLASTLTANDNLDDDPLKALENFMIPVAYIPTGETINEIKEDIGFISEVVGKKEQGKKLISDMEEKLVMLKEKVNSEEEKLRVYFEISPAPSMYSFGSDVFLQELLEIVGVENIFANKSGWLSVEGESVVAANPDVIFTNVSYIDSAVEGIINRSGWEEVNAIRNNRVYYINDNATSLSNHNIVIAVEQMVEALYDVETEGE